MGARRRCVYTFDETTGMTAGLRLQPVITTVLMPPRTAVTAVDGHESDYYYYYYYIALADRVPRVPAHRTSHLGNAHRPDRLRLFIFEGKNKTLENPESNRFFFANATCLRVF